jgi:creatinine amidohydrolase
VTGREEGAVKVLLADMTWPEVRERIRPNAVAVVPVAATEQHGPHLPLETDTRLVTEFARRAAERVAATIPIVVTPTQAIGFSAHHLDFPGTLSLSMPTYVAVLVELGDCLIRHGFRKVLLLNGHGGNHEAIQVAVRQLMATHAVVAGAATYWTVARAALDAVDVAAVGGAPGHASGFETSCMLALRPELVDLGQLPTEDQSRPREADGRATLRGMGVMLTPHAGQHPASGIWGDPTLVRPDRGPIFVEAVVAALAELFVAFSRTDGY